MPEDNTPFTNDFDELVGEEPETLLGNVKHITEIPIYPQEVVLFPYEKMTLQISDPEIQQMMLDVQEADSMVGISYRPKGNEDAPPLGSIGVAANVESIAKTDYGKLWLVELEGVIRYEVDEYIKTYKPYPVAKISYFEDKKEDVEIHRPLVAEMKVLLKRLNQGWGRHKRLEDLPDMFDEYHVHIYSFFFWTMIPMPPEVRLRLIQLRSSGARLFAFNQHVKRDLDNRDKYPKPGYN